MALLPLFQKSWKQYQRYYADEYWPGKGVTSPERHWRNLLDLLDVLHAAALAAAEDAQERPRPADAQDRVGAQKPGHPAGPSAGDDELPRLSHLPLHQHQRRGRGHPRYPPRKV